MSKYFQFSWVYAGPESSTLGYHLGLWETANLFVLAEVSFILPSDAIYVPTSNVWGLASSCHHFSLPFWLQGICVSLCIKWHFTVFWLAYSQWLMLNSFGVLSPFAYLLLNNACLYSLVVFIGVIFSHLAMSYLYIIVSSYKSPCKLWLATPHSHSLTPLFSPDDALWCCHCFHTDYKWGETAFKPFMYHHGWLLLRVCAYF